MSANTTPIFPAVPVIGMGTIAAANTAKDGTGTVVTVLTAGANGARVDKIKVRPTGTCVQTVLRVFLNNGSDNTVASNNTLYTEKTIVPATLTEVAEQTDTEILLDVALPAGYKINVSLGTAVAAPLAVTCEGGNY